MHFACLTTSSRHAVKQTRPHLWHFRSFTTSLSQAYVQGPSTHQLLSNYTPCISPNPHARSIGVLGGGISGLATAFNLSRDLPEAQITIYEAQHRLGGWMESEIVEVDGGEVLFEWGPRSLRPDLGGSGQATAALLCSLKDDVEDIPALCIPKTAPAATNRFIYYPDHLVRMPARDPRRGTLGNLISNFTTIINEPIFDGVIRSILTEPYKEPRPNMVKDESVGDFVSRRFGKALADNLLSALFHGIYAGDIYNLSARTLLPALWHLETRDKDGNGILMELAELFFRQHSLLPYGPLEFQSRYTNNLGFRQRSFLRKLSHASVYTFPKGLQYLSDTLTEHLQATPNVTIKTNTSARSVTFDKSNRRFTLATAQPESASVIEHTHDYLISTLPPTTMSSLLPSEYQPAALSSALDRSSNSVTVLVVNLYYSSPSFSTIPDGFGYLLPRTTPLDQNPERALGVIFGSCTSGPRGDLAVTDREWHPPTAEVVDAFRDAVINTQERLAKVVEDFGDRGDTRAGSSGGSDTAAKLIHDTSKDMANITLALKDLEEKQEMPDRAWKERVGQDTAPGTKLTVMIGGHWWSNWQEGDYPTEQEGIEMAKSVLKRHLKIEEEPRVAKAKLQRDCIPQYQVGYRDDMAEIHKRIASLFEGRFKLIGPAWQGGVGVNDCIKRAKEVSTMVREGWDDQTGLEGFVEKEKWCIRDKSTGMVYVDPLSNKG